MPMQFIVGVDEVGRGSWAGPLVAGAVVLSRQIKGLQDSKVLTKRQREQLAASIEIEALSIGLGWVSPKEIDVLGLTIAVRTAMERAIEQIHVPYRQIIIDGSFNFFPENEQVQAVAKADATIASVSAASIVAKVARDKYMQDMNVLYPDYQFHKHVGYGTSLHAKMLKQFGPCELHRQSYKPVQALLSV